MAAGGQSISMGAMGKRSRRIARRALDIQEKQFQKTLDFNERQAALNRQFIEDYYNKYDSPEAMVKQYKAAGLNPFSYSGQTGSMSSSMGNEPFADPNAAMKPYDNLSQIAQSYEQQGQQQSAVIQNMLSSVYQNINALEQAKSLRLDNDRKEIENDQLRKGNDIFNTPLTSGDLADMSNLNPDWFDKFNARGVAPTFGDLLYESMYKEGARRLYDSGLGSNSQQSPLMRELARYYANHRSWVEDSKGELPNWQQDKFEKVYGKAFDVAWQELLAGEKQHEYDAWKYDWNRRLQSKGINPDGNDLLNTAVRLIYGNGGEEFVNDLSSVLGDMFGKADSGIKLLRKLYKTPYQKGKK